MAFFAVAGQGHESYHRAKVREALHHPDSRVFSVERQGLDVSLLLGLSQDRAVQVPCRTIFKAASATTGTTLPVLIDGVRACSQTSVRKIR